MATKKRRAERATRLQAEDDVFRALDGGRLSARAAKALAGDDGEIRDAVLQRLDRERVLDDARLQIELRQEARALAARLLLVIDGLRVAEDPTDPLTTRLQQLRSIADAQRKAPRLPDMLAPLDRAAVEELRAALESALNVIPDHAVADVQVAVAESAVPRYGSTDDVSVALGKSRSWLRANRDRRRNDATQRRKK